MAANEKPETGEDWKARYPRWREWLWLLVLAIIAVVLNILILPDPARKVTGWWAFWSEDSGNIRDLILIIAGIAGVPFVIWREVSTDRAARAAARQAEIAADRHVKQTEADRERRITDSFTKAVELLGKPELEVRLGAIYALERIAHESKRDHWPIIETLTAYVRTKSPAQVKAQDASLSNRNYFSDEATAACASTVADGTAEAAQESGQSSLTQLGADIQAVLTVLTRRTVEYEEPNQSINLIGADLSGIDVPEVKLHGAFLHGVKLHGALLYGVKLRRAGLIGADLIGADLRRADLSWADLREANLHGAKLFAADLRKAFLIMAKLFAADLREADLRGAGLVGTDLREADLFRADLREANLHGAKLGEADLRWANLSKAHLISADLSGADLLRAHLHEANLTGVDLSRADLTGAKLDGTKLENAKFCQTTMPDGTVNNRD
jgi:uncharacterized protein YjbI with pentapeptide repeats